FQPLLVRQARQSGKGLARDDRHQRQSKRQGAERSIAEEEFRGVCLPPCEIAADREHRCQIKQNDAVVDWRKRREQHRQWACLTGDTNVKARMVSRFGGRCMHVRRNRELSLDAETAYMFAAPSKATKSSRWQAPRRC